MAVVVVRVIKIVGMKDNCFSTLDNTIKTKFFSHPEGGVEILSAEISDPYDSVLLLEF